MIDHIAELRAELAGSALTKSEIAKAKAEIAQAKTAARKQRRA